MLSKTAARAVRASVVAMTMVLGVSGAGFAGTEFGSDEDVRAVVSKFVAFVQANGTDAAVAALRDKGNEFGGALPGLMIWVDNKMGAHSKYPDLSGVDFASIKDLRERPIIEEFSAAADKGGDYTLNYWPHYVSEAEYEYHCFSTWVEKPRVMVTACR